MVEEGFIKYQCQMSIYYNYAPDEKISYLILIIVSIDIHLRLLENVLWTLHVDFLGFSHWFIDIMILQMKGHSVLLYQSRYATYIVSKYMDTTKLNTSTQFYKTTLPSDMIFTKDDVSTSYEKVDKLTA